MKLKKDEFNKEMNNGWLLTNKQIDFISRYGDLFQSIKIINNLRDHSLF